MRAEAIGVFDSGIGGLTVVAALRRRLPDERIIYLGDTARLPYGTKSPATIRRYSLQNADFLLQRGIKLLVIACNTASAWALAELRQASPVPAIDVVGPGCRRAAEVSRGGRIGVIGTDATIRSEAYPKAIRALLPEAEVASRSCPLFVPLVEEGWLEGPVTEQVVEVYLGDFRHSGIDCLVLGCTHYPLLKPAISRFLGGGVELVDSAEAVAAEVERELRAADLLAGGSRRPDRFFLTDRSPTFRRAMALFLGGEASGAELVDINDAGEENR